MALLTGRRIVFWLLVYSAVGAALTGLLVLYHVLTA